MKEIQYFCVLTRTGQTLGGHTLNVTFSQVVDVVSADVTAYQVYESVTKASDAKLVEKGMPYVGQTSVMCWSMQRNDLGLGSEFGLEV